MTELLRVLRNKFHYEHETGLLLRREASRSKVAFSSAGWVGNHGYLELKICGVKYLLHRLIWLYVYGEWPKHTIDHKDGNKINNRISNLRDVADRENKQNIYKARGKSRYLGIYSGNGKWRACIRVNNKTIHLGTFLSEEDAHSAYVDAKRKLHPYSNL